MTANSRLRRKKRELEALETQYGLLNEKIKRLRASHAIETGAAVRFQLEQEIKQAEMERRDVERQIDSLENEIEALESELGRLSPEKVEKTWPTRTEFSLLPDSLSKPSSGLDIKNIELVFSKRFWFAVLVFIVIIRIAPDVVVQPSPSTPMPSVTLYSKSGDEIVEFIISEESFGTVVEIVIMIVSICIVGAPLSFVIAWLYFTRVFAEKRASDETISAADITILNIKNDDQITKTIDSVSGTYHHMPPNKDIWLIVSHRSVWYPMNGPAEKYKRGWLHKLGFLRNGQYELSVALTSARTSEYLKSAVKHREQYSCPMKDIGLEPIETIHIQVQIDET